MNVYVVSDTHGYIKNEHIHTRNIEKATFFKSYEDAQREAKLIHVKLNPQIFEFELVPKGSMPIN